jgi:hypothetical protein
MPFIESLVNHQQHVRLKNPKDGARSGDKRRSLRGFLGRKRASPSTMELLARFIDYGTAVHCWEHGTKYAGT